MTREEAIKMIKAEQLINFNLNEKRFNKENEVGILENNGLWTVYATDERASIVTGSEKVFDNESDALENFIKRLRASKILSDLNINF